MAQQIWRALAADGEARQGPTERTSATALDREANALRSAPKAEAPSCSAFPFDREEANRLLEFLGGRDSSFFFLMLKDKGQPKGPALQRRSQVHRLVPRFEALQAEGYGIFVAVNEFSGDRRQISDLVKIRAVWAEIDCGVMPDWPIEPSLIVESSLGRFHVYFFVDPACPLSLADFNAVMSRLVATYHCDPNAKDATRVLRLPGSWHRKLEYGRDHVSHLVRVIGGAGATYRGEELEAAFPAPASARATAARKPIIASGSLDRFVEPLKQINSDDYGLWITVGMALHTESSGSEAGLDLWDAWSSRSPKYQLGDCEGRWRGFSGRSGGPVTGGTIIWLARTGGRP
jgi:hypothetical protein